MPARNPPRGVCGGPPRPIHGTCRSSLSSAPPVPRRGVWLAAIAVGVARHAGVTVLLAATLLAYVVRVALGAGLVFRRWGAPVLRIEPARLRALVAQGAPYGAAMLCIVLYGRVGLMMLKALATSRDVAHFQIAYLLSQPLGFIDRKSTRLNSSHTDIT